MYVCVVAKAVWVVFAIHKNNLPTKCSTRTDVCVWLPRQSGQSLLSTRTIYLLSAQLGLMCVWLPRQSGQSLLSTRTIYLLSAQQRLMFVCGCPDSLDSLCSPQGQTTYLVLNKD